jgi:PEP-CTERM motif
MIKKMLVGVLTLVGLSMVASAAPIDCTGVTTLQQLISANGVNGGCTHQDKIFNNFVYTGGGVTAGSVSAIHETSGGGISLADVHGWLFSTSGGWNTGFTLSYDVSVDVANFPLLRIFASKDQLQTGLTPNADNMVDTQSVGTLHTFGVLGNETAQIQYANQTTVHTSSVFSCIGGGNCNLQSYEQNFFEAAVPEPASFGLIGLGLVGLAALKRRQKSVR